MTYIIDESIQHANCVSQGESRACSHSGPLLAALASAHPCLSSSLQTCSYGSDAVRAASTHFRSDFFTIFFAVLQAEKQAQAQAAAAAVKQGVPELQQAGKWGYAQLQYQVGHGADRVLYASNQAPNTSSTNDLCASPTGFL